MYYRGRCLFVSRQGTLVSDLFHNPCRWDPEDEAIPDALKCTFFRSPNKAGEALLHTMYPTGARRQTMNARKEFHIRGVSVNELIAKGETIQQQP